MTTKETMLKLAETMAVAMVGDKDAEMLIEARAELAAALDEVCQAADLLQSQAKRIAELESALQSANTTIEELEHKYYLTLDQRDDAVYMLADWCISVEQDASWDGWDDCYKNAMYRPCSIRELIDDEIEVQKDQ